MNIHFEKANLTHQKVIFAWLKEPHMQEFWDNSQQHKDDILNFLQGRKEKSNYFEGLITYWIGLVDNHPFSFLLTSEMSSSQTDITDLHREHLSKTGHTITIDFGIGNTHFLGKGLASLTLKTFMDFFHSKIDPEADTFFIDPDEKNPKAYHIYEKAGFKPVGNFDPLTGVFKGSLSHLMVKRL